MSLEILGEGFDIHGGGDDLVFPHHENEIAQAVGAGHEFARHWLHAGMVNTKGEKMSKSLGNFVTLAKTCSIASTRARIRLLVLQTHYRKQMEFGETELADAEKALERIDALVRNARADNLPEVAAAEAAPFRDAMDDDFDTPAAVAYVFELVREANTARAEQRRDDAATLVATVVELAGVLGIDPKTEVPELDEEIAALVTERDEARARKDFATSDRIRDELLARGIALEDTPDGTVWRRA